MATPTSISSSPTSSPAPRDSHPPTDPLVWFLIGAAALLCLYSFIVTILFHKLKVRQRLRRAQFDHNSFYKRWML